MRILLAYCLTLLLSSCEGEEKINVRLTMDERETVDNTTRARMDSIRPRMEADCVAKFEDRVSVTTDSIVQRLLEEEVRLRARIAKNGGQ